MKIIIKNGEGSQITEFFPKSEDEVSYQLVKSVREFAFAEGFARGLVKAGAMSVKDARVLFEEIKPK